MILPQRCRYSPHILITYKYKRTVTRFNQNDTIIPSFKFATITRLWYNYTANLTHVWRLRQAKFYNQLQPFLRVQIQFKNKSNNFFTLTQYRIYRIHL